MKALILLLLFLTTHSFAKQSIWTQHTQALSESKAKQIIDSYIENNATQNIKFEDDIVEKETFDFTENIFTFGLELGAESNSEKIYNLSGEKTETYGSTNVKFIFGKDFTLWHEEYTQPTRLYIAYDYSVLGEDLSYTTFAFGLKENMYYWSLYQNDLLNIYPTMNFELGSSSINRDTLSTEGYYSGFGAGVALIFNGNFEYFLNFNTKSIDWNHPVDGIADEQSVYSLSFGLTYKLMYGDI